MFPTMLTLIAAAVAAYTAVLKTKQEKLWAERYEKTGQALIRANLVVRFLESVSNEHEIHGLTSHEKAALSEGWPIARYELERDMVLFQLLFNAADLEQVDSAWLDLQRELFWLLEEAGSHDAHSYVRKALPKARELETAIVELARRRCVDPFYVGWRTAFSQWREARRKKH